MASATKPRVAFVSGHTDLTEGEFTDIYVPLLDTALADGHSFLMGDASGVDTQALNYLLSDTVQGKHPDVKQRITVFASRKYNVPRLQQLGIKVVAPDDPLIDAGIDSKYKDLIGVRKTGRDAARFRHIVRDMHLTLNSDYDILHVRSEKDSRALYGDRWRPRVSGTEMNRERRLKIQSGVAGASSE